jgi:hypothetical protein
MTFRGFDPKSLRRLGSLPTLSAAEYETLKPNLAAGLVEPAAPRIIAHPAFAAWCAERRLELMPVHRWLVRELLTKGAAMSAAKLPRRRCAESRSRAARVA